MSQFFRVILTHNTSGQPMPPQPSRVLCASHAHHTNSCARYEKQPIDGEWECHECYLFTPVKQMDLANLLRDPKFSHVSIRGEERHIGAVYFRDDTSPTGVRYAGGFDPFCPKAMEIVRQRTTPNDGPQRGSMAGRGGW